MANGIPVGRPELAAHFGVSVSAIDRWRQRHDDFPGPRWRVGGGPCWLLADVVAWHESRGRSTPEAKAPDAPQRQMSRRYTPDELRRMAAERRESAARAETQGETPAAAAREVEPRFKR